jgi:hypothetical protein
MAYDFNGSTQHLSAGLSVSGSPYTMHCFANRDISSVSLCVTIARSNTGTYYSCLVPLNAANGDLLRFQVSDGLASWAVTSQTISTGSWQSFGGRQTNATSRKVFLQGTATGTNSDSKDPTSMDRILIGAGVTGSESTNVTNYFDGKLAEVAIWNTDLNDDEMISLSKGFRATKVRPQSLVFYAPLVRNLIDAKGGLTITNNNSATVADHPRIYG